MAGNAPGSPAGGRRRRQAVAARLRRAALQLFAERGFDDVSVEEIALAAGVPRRSFFSHFAGKADVLLSLSADDSDLGLRTGAWTGLRGG